jgi:hypothetical protein
MRQIISRIDVINVSCGTSGRVSRIEAKLGEEWGEDDFEVIQFVRAEPAVYSRPEDEITKRFHKSLESIVEDVSDGWSLFAVTWGDTSTPTQRPVDEPELIGISRQWATTYLQLDLFADHPEIAGVWPQEGISVAALDLLGAAVLEWSDIREPHLVADLVGLLRRSHAPLEEIADLAISMFRLVALISGAQKISVGDAHQQFLKHHRAMT